MEPVEAKAQTIQYLTELKRQLTEKRDRLMGPIRELDAKIAGVVSTIATILEGPKPLDESPRATLLRRLKGLSQPKALIEIAKYNAGVLNAKEAKTLMITAGIMQETKNSASIVHSTIRRTEAFVRERRGIYRLKGSTSPKAQLSPTIAELDGSIKELHGTIKTVSSIKPVQ
jgi:hypothetical protein